MSKLLLLATQAQVQQTRQLPAAQAGELIPFSLSGLISYILKDQGVAYRENPIIEHLACWEALWDLQDELTAFQTIQEFPGFVRDLLLLFSQIGHQEPILADLSDEDRDELLKLYQRYQHNLANRRAFDGAKQLNKALEELPNCDWLAEVDEIEQAYLGPLSPLEEGLLDKLSQGRKLTTRQPRPAGTTQVLIARDPYHELQFVADQIRQQLTQGASPEEIGVAVVDYTSYLPIIESVFRQFGIPFQQRGVTIDQTPLGRSVLMLLNGMIANWPKESLNLLATPGWGITATIDETSRQALKMAPPLKGIAAWKGQLQDSRWQEFLNQLESYEQMFVNQPLSEHSRMLKQLVLTLATNDMEATDEYHLGYQLQATDGIIQICDALGESDYLVSREQFVKLFAASCGDYQLKPARSFWSEIKVTSPHQLVGQHFATVYVVGLRDGSFPRSENTHWLTKRAIKHDEERLFKELLACGEKVNLLFPENDEDGRMNLPSPLIEMDKPKRLPKAKVIPNKATQVVLGNGKLQDQRVIEAFRSKLVTNGLSVSQLTAFAQCPFSFYCQVVLGIEPIQEDTGELTAADEGTLVHQALQKFWGNHLSGPIPTAEQAEEEIVQIAGEIFGEQGEQLPARLERLFIRFVLQDLSRLPQGYRPYLLEQRFGDLSIPTPLGNIPVRGVIDRIDFNEQTSDYILYDYKTGTNPSLKDMTQGGHLQIPIYLLAAEKMLKGRVVGAAFYSFKEAKPQGIWLSSELKNLGLRKTPYCYGPEEWEELMNHFKGMLIDTVQKILGGEFLVEPFKDQVCSYCPFQDICRREVN